MNRSPVGPVACALALAVATCLAGPVAAQSHDHAAMTQQAQTQNPFFAPSSLEYNSPR